MKSIRLSGFLTAFSHSCCGTSRAKAQRGICRDKDRELTAAIREFRHDLNDGAKIKAKVRTPLA